MPKGRREEYKSPLPGLAACNFEVYGPSFLSLPSLDPIFRGLWGLAKEPEAYRALGGLGLHRGLVALWDSKSLGSVGVGFPGVAYSLLGD